MHERDAQKGWKQKLLTWHKCRQEMSFMHSQRRELSSVAALCSASGLYPQFIRHSSDYTEGLGFFHLFWTNAISVNKDSGPRLSFAPLTLP